MYKLSSEGKLRIICLLNTRMKKHSILIILLLQDISIRCKPDHESEYLNPRISSLPSVALSYFYICCLH
eukprot:snap_masked-scaffold_11-processed-gene-6.40-mRNA-1 protein AED:1.00 eAED:1.00 QI:0/0/0/0/1/1/3/0/68